VTGFCAVCRPVPAVNRNGHLIDIEGLGTLSVDAAIDLAHRIADCVERVNGDD
jgi:hypothetical protein